MLICFKDVRFKPTGTKFPTTNDLIGLLALEKTRDILPPTTSMTRLDASLEVLSLLPMDKSLALEE